MILNFIKFLKEGLLMPLTTKRIWIVLSLLASVSRGQPAIAQLAAVGVEDKINLLQQQMLDMQKELEALRDQQKKAAEEAQKRQQTATQQIENVKEELTEKTLGLLDRVKIGGYGSLRYEGNSLHDQSDTFTFRRFVLTTEAKISPRLRFAAELEFERFRKLELERSVGRSGAGLLAEQAIEGTHGSEIALEQAWLQYDMAEWFNLRAGAVLVPLGRFNIRHDDNLWNLPRRSLVDRGVSVLPSPAAWDELGIGFVGKRPVGKSGLLDYQFYVVNGVSLDAEIEHIAQSREGARGKLETEVKISPQTGSFANDSKGAKSLTGRFAYSPLPGHELAGSFYWGRYTPKYLNSEQVWSLGLDGFTHVGPIELEGQYIYTHFGGLRNVARKFAQVVRDQESVVEDTFSPTLETEMKFELGNLSSTKHGYWLEARYPFWPAFLDKSFLGWDFTNPQLIPIVRMEQVWMPTLLQEAEFSDGILEEFKRASRFVHRVTAGLAYRPTPLVGFTVAYEYTWTNNGKSLANVTNFLPARGRENSVHSLLAGVTFGF
jgi:opacity protein-like surface antigen